MDCAFCKGEIPLEASKCRHCGEWQPNKGPAPKGKDRWEKIGVVIPVCAALATGALALLGAFFKNDLDGKIANLNNAVARSEVDAKFVEMAVGVLKQEPRGTDPTDKYVRAWAIEVANHFLPEAKINDEARKGLIEKAPFIDPFRPETPHVGTPTNSEGGETPFPMTRRSRLTLANITYHSPEEAGTFPPPPEIKWKVYRDGRYLKEAQVVDRIQNGVYTTRFVYIRPVIKPYITFKINKGGDTQEHVIMSNYDTDGEKHLVLDGAVKQGDVTISEAVEGGTRLELTVKFNWDGGSYKFVGVSEFAE